METGSKLPKGEETITADTQTECDERGWRLPHAWGKGDGWRISRPASGTGRAGAPTDGAPDHTPVGEPERRADVGAGAK
jgi:hypothetical protein